MDDNFVLKFGKYVGKTYGWVSKNAPNYITWARDNAPNLLKESKPKPQVIEIEKKEIKFREGPVNTMVPNMSFWVEGPADICKPYLDRMKEINEKDLEK